MSAEHVLDLAVIGGGSGGVRCARTAASLGARVAIFEEGAFGGTCVNLGCVPKKLLAYGAHVAHELADARGIGWPIPEMRLDWRELLTRKDREILRLNGAYEGLLVAAGVEIVRARAKIGGTPGALVVDAGDRTYAAKNVVIATGGYPRRPEIPGAELADVSDDFFHWPALPGSIVIIGAGYVAVEIASVLAALGVQIDLLARNEVLSGFDPDVRTFFASELQKTGIRVHEHRGDVTGIEIEGGLRVVHDARGGRFVAERALLGIGRVPRSRGLGLEALGVAIEQQAVISDARYHTNVPGVYAIGDVTSKTELTPVALAEGMLLARALFGAPGGTLPYELVPTAVFSMPPVAVVGMSEPTARARGLSVKIFRTSFKPLKHTITGRDQRTMMKIVVDAASDRVLGIHMVGDDAPEIIQGFAVALMAGVTKAQMDATIGVHPTSAEEMVTMRTPVG